MKKLIPLLSLLLPMLVHGQADIAEARTFADGQTVTVTGVVTNGSEFGPIRYMQDATGGISAYPGTGSVPFAPVPGDNITITGTMARYNGLTELNPITAFTINSSGNPLPAPQVITPAQMDENVECELVQIDDATFAAGGSQFTSTTWDITASSESGIVFFNGASPFIGTTVPSGVVNITGIASQYTFTVGGYQLLPRTAADIVLTSAVNVTGPVLQQNITTTSFDLSWTTDNAGSSFVNYGLTPAMGTIVGDVTSTTAHTVPLPGLAPATIYYAEVFSVLGADTASTTVHVYSTASLSSGIMRAYFNQSVDNTVATHQNAVGLFGAVNDTIAAYIARANTTIDVAMYNESDAVIVTALNTAVANGVQVRYITEGGNTNTGLSSLDASVPVLERMNSTGSGMHNKFMIIDADDVDNAWVMSGSLNWTTDNLFDDQNNLVFIQDQSLARAYRLEFEEMWGGNGPQPNVANSRFGPDKTDNTPHEFIIGGDRIESYFSPSDHTNSHIVEAISHTDRTIHFALLVITDNNISNALIAANNTFGVSAAGLVEQVNGTGSDYDLLVTNGLEMYSYANIPGLLHHKYGIIDEGFPQFDPLVITGSHNWSSSADSDNDENTLFIHNDTIANLFWQEWHARGTVGIAENAGIISALSVYPVPANDQLHIRYALAEGGVTTTTVLDATGRVVFTQRSSAAPGANSDNIDTSFLPEGFYMLTLESHGARQQAAFVKAK
ncbi:MAG: phospholipase D-like domain-containing protein [Flavobacteriales bacterium]